MKASDRGLKHICPDCATRYYDLKAKDPVCPKCGAKAPPPVKLLKSAQPASKTGRATFGRVR